MFLVRQLECFSFFVGKYSGSGMYVWVLCSCLFFYCRSSREDLLAFILIYFFSVCMFQSWFLKCHFFLICVKMQQMGFQGVIFVLGGRMVQIDPPSSFQSFPQETCFHMYLYIPSVILRTTWVSRLCRLVSSESRILTAPLCFLVWPPCLQILKALDFNLLIISFSLILLYCH